ncbi:MAG: hypothetical protein ACFFCQ_12335 [Promethearchaeota archaeon]
MIKPAVHALVMLTLNASHSWHTSSIFPKKAKRTTKFSIHTNSHTTKKKFTSNIEIK